MSSTPRAEQFEDRLKTIIHSVLAGDSDQREAAAAKSNPDVKPPLHVLPYAINSPPQGASSSKPMFSPVKKELPTHLPLPPSGVVGADKTGCSNASLPRPQQSYRTTGSSVQHGSSVSQVGAPTAYSHTSSGIPMNRQGNHIAGAETESSLAKARTDSYYQQPSGIGGRPSSEGPVSVMASRPVNDSMSSEMEKNVESVVTSRSMENTNIRTSNFSSLPSHISHESSLSNHGHPKMAHSNPVTSRIPPSFVPGSSVPSSMPSRVGAPSMARMSQGKLQYPCIYISDFMLLAPKSI